METISHREMRNHSAEVLRRVEAGESIQVSNNGRLAALIVPVGGNALDALIARGEVREALTDLTALSSITRAVSSAGTAELLADSRGRW